MRWRTGAALLVFFLAGVLVGSRLDPLAPPPQPAPEAGPRTEAAPEVTPFAPSEGSERQHRRLEVADLVAMFPGRVIRSGPPDRRLIALTFDDGPDDVFTPRILDTLKQQGVHATFFVTGLMADRRPAIMQRIVDEGHAVASHGYRHIRYSAVEPAAIRDDLARNRDLLQRYTGEPARLFRPPYGALDRLAASLVLDEGYLIVLWTVDTRDWLGRSAAQITETVTSEARNGSIVLQHAASGGDVDLSGTVAALPRFIRTLRERGFVFVTVPELLGATRAEQGVNAPGAAP